MFMFGICGMTVRSKCGSMKDRTGKFDSRMMLPEDEAVQMIKIRLKGVVQLYVDICREEWKDKCEM
jgi:hypothetical protein